MPCATHPQSENNASNQNQITFIIIHFKELSLSAYQREFRIPRIPIHSRSLTLQKYQNAY